MALVATPRPGNLTRVECTGCSDAVVLTSRLSAVAVAGLIAQTEALHRCA